jgi:hypothetical protein
LSLWLSIRFSIESDAEKQTEALREGEKMVFIASLVFLSMLLLTIQERFISSKSKVFSSCKFLADLRGLMTTLFVFADYIK